MNTYRIGFTFSFQGGPIKTNYRTVRADSPEAAIHDLLYFMPSAIKAWIATETNSVMSTHRRDIKSRYAV